MTARDIVRGRFQVSTTVIKWLAILAAVLSLGAASVAAVAYVKNADTVRGLADSESEASVTRVLSADQRCEFSRKVARNAQAGAALSAEITIFVRKAGVPPAQSAGLRLRAADVQHGAATLDGDVRACLRTRDRYFAELTDVERDRYEHRRR